MNPFLSMQKNKYCKHDDELIYAPKLGVTFTARIFTKILFNSINFRENLCQILFKFEEKCRKKFFSFLGLNKVPF